MTKEDLKTRMLISTQQNGIGLVLGNFIYYKSGGYDHIYSIPIDLNSRDLRFIVINSVSKVLDGDNLAIRNWSEETINRNLLWSYNQISIKVTVNGKEVSPSAISEETWKNLRNG